MIGVDGTTTLTHLVSRRGSLRLHSHHTKEHNSGMDHGSHASYLAPTRRAVMSRKCCIRTLAWLNSANPCSGYPHLVSGTRKLMICRTVSISGKLRLSRLTDPEDRPLGTFDIERGVVSVFLGDVPVPSVVVERELL